MATRVEDVITAAPTARNVQSPLIGTAADTPGDKALILKPLLGVLYDTPADKAKNREHLFYLAAKNLPALAAIYWIATQPTGWIVWTAFAAFYVMNILSMSIGYHRYFTHKAFETSRPMHYAIAILAQLGIFGSLRRWVAEHRRHHAHSDRRGDIHSPYFDDFGDATGGAKGWKYSHLGWVFSHSMTDEKVYGKGVADDDAILFVDKYRIPIFFISVLVLPALWAMAFGGDTQTIIGTILVAGFLRSVVALHAIACVNSFGHMYGSKRFTDGHDEARNNWLIALLTLGEGWHNNHHAHPRSANAGLAWYEIDMTAAIIRLMERLGLVWNVRWAKLDAGQR
jgi:stearoyl-CoA desaturase (Delta-9 desaturase)